MKIILINPSSGLNKPLNRFIKFEPPVPPLGLASIAAVLCRENAEIMILDQVANGFTNEKIINIVARHKADIVGFSCLSTAMTNAAIIIRGIKERMNNILVILGNIHPTLFADEILKTGLADIVVRGEGEKIFVHLVKRLNKGNTYADVRGISFKNNGQIMHNPDESPIEPLGSLPYPDWSFFELDRYGSCPMLMIKGRAVTIQASRGCPHSCFFCGQESMNKKVRSKQSGRLVDEIEYLNKKHLIKYFGFVDSYFPMNTEQGFKFADEMQKRGLHKKIRWFTETRVDKVDYKLLRELKKSGLYLVQYGFESGNQEVLDAMHKNITLDASRLAMETTKKAGIFSVGLFILGMPGETKESCTQTIEFAKELDCDIAKFNIATPYPGSQFFSYFKDKLPKNISTSRFTSWLDWGDGSDELIYCPEALSKQGLINLQRKAMFDFYVRPKIITRHLLKGTIPLHQLLIGGSLVIKKYLTSKKWRDEDILCFPRL